MKRFFLVLALILSFAQATPRTPNGQTFGPFRVTRVSDGDTVKLESIGKVRLIGIDTPEVYNSEKRTRDAQRAGVSVQTIRALGRRASTYAKKWMSKKLVFIELDVQQKDRYQRTLGYLYIRDGHGEFVINGVRSSQINLEMVKAGFATVSTFPPNVQYQKLYLEAERSARAAKRGLWSK
jgi:micrococcal nuclease